MKKMIETEFGLLPEKLKLFGAAFPKSMGVKITSATKKKIMAELILKPVFQNKNARANGGALMAFADCIGAAGTVMNMPDGFFTTTLESKTNFLSGGVGPVLKAVSIPLHIGRTTMVWQTTIKNSSDDKKVAIVTQTQIVIPPKKNNV